MEWFLILFIVTGIIVFIVTLMLILYFQYITPIPTSTLNESVSVVRTGIVNAFIYTSGFNTILIDTGTSAKKLKKGLEFLNIDIHSISDVFFTHGDPDHIGGNSLFKNAQFHIGQESKVNNPTRYNFLQDKAIINIGEIKVQAISTPGHRLGHVIYKIDGECLFTGDALRLKDGYVTPFLRIISSDFDKQVESIKKIAQLEDIRYMFTAHNGYTTNFEEAFKEWKE